MPLLLLLCVQVRALLLAAADDRAQHAAVPYTYAFVDGRNNYGARRLASLDGPGKTREFLVRAAENALSEMIYD